ncbi:MAG: tRNA (adenosine(37)-N6)-threonylcarbamoyltransferase complex dimerization subunit type 1 TsaB [Chryseotalea sp.]|jgi:tRNA threonylcarbamoyladenosine biosynthesis protein TsaB
MEIFLSIETSSEICSVVLSKNNNLVSERRASKPNSHASELTLLIDDILHENKIEPALLKGIFLSAGPGSYTGLRIGTSTAKGMCFALGIPLIAINTLDALISQVKDSEATFLCPMIDARRTEVYTKLVRTSTHEEILSTTSCVLEPNTFENYLMEGSIAFFGSGAEKSKAWIKSDKAIFLNNIKPKAAAIAQLGFELWKKGKHENLIEFEPFYLKDFQVKKSTKPLFPPVIKRESYEK